MATATPGGIASSIEAHATKLDAANTILAGTHAAEAKPYPWIANPIQSKDQSKSNLAN